MKFPRLGRFRHHEEVIEVTKEAEVVRKEAAREIDVNSYRLDRLEEYRAARGRLLERTGNPLADTTRWEAS